MAPQFNPWLRTMATPHARVAQAVVRKGAAAVAPTWAAEAAAPVRAVEVVGEAAEAEAVAVAVDAAVVVVAVAADRSLA